VKSYEKLGYSKQDILSNRTLNLPFSVDENKRVFSIKLGSDRPHSGERRSSVGSESHTLKKSNVYLANKLHKEFVEACNKLTIWESMSRKELFNLFVSLGYFRHPQ
jgi:hypothetical protein